jgi:cell shape-determining protein MreD
MVDLDARFSQVRKAVDEGNAAVESASKIRQTKDRSLIALVVVFAFVGVVIIVSVAALLGDWTKLEAPSEYVLKLLSSVLLPVVTLVIGYYFGKEN